MAKKVNTTATIAKESANVTEREYRDSLARTSRIFKDMPKKTVSIPKQMVNVLGESLPVSINGVTIVVPVDGKPHEIPEAYVDVILNSLQAVQAEDVKAEVVEQQGLKGSN